MAEKQQITGKTIILTSVAGVIIGAPLLGLMGFSFLATVALLLVTSPLLLLFSPLLFGAALVFALAMLGFASAGIMAVAGASMVARVLEKVTSGGGAREVEGKGLGGYLQGKADNPVEYMVINTQGWP